MRNWKKLLLACLICATPALAQQAVYQPISNAVIGAYSGFADYLTSTGSASGGTPTIAAVGTDANIPINVALKGTGSFNITSGFSGAATSVRKFIDSLGATRDNLLANGTETWSIYNTAATANIGSIYWTYSATSPYIGIYPQSGSNGVAIGSDSAGDALYNNLKVPVGTSNLAAPGEVYITGTAPTIAAGAAAGTSPTVSVAGTYASGVVNVTTGTATTASATLATVTFPTISGFVAPQGCELMPRNALSAAAVAMVYTTAPSTTTWAVGIGGTALTASTAYSWSYFCQ